MKFEIENVTEDDMAWDEYSVMRGMEVFTATVHEEVYEVYDSSLAQLTGSLREDIIIAVEAFRGAEK